MSFLAGFIPIIDKALGITQSFVDPDKREKALHNAFLKNGRKALNIAEDIMELVDQHYADLPKSFQRKYTRMKRRFNDFD